MSALLFFSAFMDQLHLELDNVLQSLSLNGYSVFSLINDILVCCNQEDKRIKVLWEGLEHDTADICTCLLSHCHGHVGALIFILSYLKDT